MADGFARLLHETISSTRLLPFSGTSYDLLTGAVVTQTEGIRMKDELHPRDARAAKVFTRLISACEKLMRVARSSEGMANKEMGRFADQVEQLADKWSR